jgi:hypothetical protein
MDKKVFENWPLVNRELKTKKEEGLSPLKSASGLDFEVNFRFRLRSQLPAEVAEKETFPDMTIFDPVS